jgi:hypothetical protein
MSVVMLIDAENVCCNYVQALKTDAARHGDMSSIQVFADFSSPQMAGWNRAVKEYGLIPVMQQHTDMT